MFINDNDVGTDCEGSAELGEHTDVQAVREQGTDFTSSREVERQEREGGSVQRKKKKEEHEGCMPEVAVKMCMREGDSERQGERV